MSQGEGGSGTLDWGKKVGQGFPPGQKVSLEISPGKKMSWETLQERKWARRPARGGGGRKKRDLPTFPEDPLQKTDEVPGREVGQNMVGEDMGRHLQGWRDGDIELGGWGQRVGGGVRRWAVFRVRPP